MITKHTELMDPRIITTYTRKINTSDEEDRNHLLSVLLHALDDTEKKRNKAKELITTFLLGEPK
jgi:flagellar hook-basal body complex protein FliE